MQEKQETTATQIVDIIAAIDSLNRSIESLAGSVEELVARARAKDQRSLAGRKSAEVRLARRGSANPPGPLWESSLVPERKISLVREREPSVRERAKAKPTGAPVWEAYAAAYLKRYKVEPIRNAKINGQCLQLVKQLGTEIAQSLVAYYLTRDDSFYNGKCHPIGLCLLDAQKLLTEQSSGVRRTQRDAMRLETASHNDRVCEEYLQKQAEQTAIPVEVLQ